MPPPRPQVRFLSLRRLNKPCCRCEPLYGDQLIICSQLITGTYSMKPTLMACHQEGILWEALCWVCQVDNPPCPELVQNLHYLLVGGTLPAQPCTDGVHPSGSTGPARSWWGYKPFH